MDDALSTTEIKNRSITGAKWLILTNGFGMAGEYLQPQKKLFVMARRDILLER